MKQVTSGWICIVLLCSCSSAEKTPWDTALFEQMDLSEKALAFVEYDNASQVEDAYEYVAGEIDAYPSYAWIDVRSSVRASPEDVYNALLDIKVLTDRRQADSRYEGECASDMQGDASECEIYYNKIRDETFVTVDFKVAWRYYEELPGNRYRIEYQKTEGSIFIFRMMGAIEISPLYDASGSNTGFSRIAFHSELGVPRDQQLHVSNYVLDMHYDIVDTVNGKEVREEFINHF